MRSLNHQTIKKDGPSAKGKRPASSYLLSNESTTLDHILQLLYHVINFFFGIMFTE